MSGAAGQSTGPSGSPLRRSARRWGRGLAAAVFRWVRAAPGTYTWLVVLALTTLVIVQLDPRTLRHFLRQRSTNLVHLGRNPLYVLLASAFWTERPSWLIWLVLFTLVVAPVEHWLGTARWLAVVVAGHVGATLLSETHLALAINLGLAPRSSADTVDVGVSYGIAACAGVSAYRVPRPWRYGYVGLGLGALAALAVSSGEFTDYGHLDAALVGLACWPLTRPRRTP